MLLKKGIIDGLWRGEMKCIDPKAGDADVWIKMWEELHRLTSREILIEVEHVKARTAQRRTRKKCRILRGLSLMVKRRRMN